MAPLSSNIFLAPAWALLVLAAGHFGGLGAGAHLGPWGLCLLGHL